MNKGIKSVKKKSFSNIWWLFTAREIVLNNFKNIISNTKSRTGTITRTRTGIRTGTKTQIQKIFIEIAWGVFRWNCK